MTSKKTTLPLKEAFQGVSEAEKSVKKQPSPFCLRLSWDERAYLQDQAGSRPLGAYIREQLLGERARKRRVQRRPQVDEQALARVLAALKSSRLSPNVNQLAKAVHCGSLDVRPDVEQELKDACRAIQVMRNTLFMALGLKTESSQQ